MCSTDCGVADQKGATSSQKLMKRREHRKIGTEEIRQQDSPFIENTDTFISDTFVAHEMVLV